MSDNEFEVKNQNEISSHKNPKIFGCDELIEFLKTASRESFSFTGSTLSNHHSSRIRHKIETFFNGLSNVEI